MWNVKCFVVPIIIGATGVVSKSVKNIWKHYQTKFSRLSTKSRRSRNITLHKESATV
jgi:hypothetical protein